MRYLLKLTDEARLEFALLDTRAFPKLAGCIQKALESPLIPVDDFDMDKPVVRYELR